MLYEDATTTAQMTRSFEELVVVARAATTRSRPVRSCSREPGSSRRTSFTLVPGHRVEIHVPEIGTLVNPVVLASSSLTDSEGSPR